MIEMMDQQDVFVVFLNIIINDTIVSGLNIKRRLYDVMWVLKDTRSNDNIYTQEKRKIHQLYQQLVPVVSKYLLLLRLYIIMMSW